MVCPLFTVQYVPKTLGQPDVVYFSGFPEEGSYFLWSEAGYPAAYLCDQECHCRMLPGEGNEVIHIRTDGLRPAVHGWDAVSLPLQACALPPHGTPLAPCLQGGASTVGTFQVAAKYEYLTRLEGGDTIRCDSLFHTLGLVTSLNGWLNI